MREVACQFGEAEHLSGILTLPAPSIDRHTALVLVSAGLTARMGPYRLYTETARSLAGRGITTLRFDLGGIGNSEQVDFATPLLQRTQDDIRAALACLRQRHSVSTLLIGGLCSGGEDGLRYAAVDARIDGVLLIDPHAFRTPGWWLHHVASLRSLKGRTQALLRESRWLQAVRRPGSGALSEPEGALVDYHYMPYREAADALQRLVARGGRAHYIYTADRSEHFNHAGQVRRMFRGIDLGDQVSVSYLPQLEHTQFLAEDRQRLIGAVAAWTDTLVEPPQTALADAAFAMEQ